MKAVLTRVEGEGGILVVERGGYVENVFYEISEAPRFFEYIVVGRNAERVVDIVSRVCGLCGVSYSLVAAEAFEKCLGIEVDPEIRMLRAALHLAERVKSHVIHVFYMNLPEIAQAKSFAEFLQRNPQISRCAQDVLMWSRKAMEVFGGRFHNVVNIKIGGVYRVPDKSDVEKLEKEIAMVIKAFTEFASFVLSIKPSDVVQNVKIHQVSLYSSSSEYPHLSDRVSLDGDVYSVAEFYKSVSRAMQVQYSTALHYRVKGVESFVVGPFARFNQSYSKLSKEVRDFVEMYDWSPPLHSIMHSYVARIAEAYDALLTLEKYLDTFKSSAITNTSSIASTKSGAVCEYAVEAPRGILYHRYIVDIGKVKVCDIITPTAQNLAAMSDIATVAIRGRKADASSIAIAKRIAISFDPCISCSVHALPVKIITA